MTERVNQSDPLTEVESPSLTEGDAEPVVGVVDQLDTQITEILGAAAVESITQTLLKHWDETVIAEYGVLEKLNLFLVLAGRHKIAISTTLQLAIKKVAAIAPSDALDISYLSHLSKHKRKRVIQLLTSLVVLVGIGLSYGKSFITAHQDQANRDRVEQSANSSDEDTAKALEARAEFERLYSQDLATVVVEMGWEKFLQEYADYHELSNWTSQEVFDLLRKQEPRYWGRFVVAHPAVFLEVVSQSQITLSEFMSSCGSEKFFSYVYYQQGAEVTWFELWSMEEMVQTLKLIDPNWSRVVVDRQELFVGVLTANDLPTLIRSLSLDFYQMSRFLGEYHPDWDQSWSRRELIDRIKLEVVDWEVLVRKNIEVFADDLTREELEAVVRYIGVNYPSLDYIADKRDLRIFTDFYDLGLYKIVSPAEFASLIETEFKTDVDKQIWVTKPEISEIAGKSLQELFELKAMPYILDNYTEWESEYPIDEIIEFLRVSNDAGKYAVIIPYPHLFSEVVFTNPEISILAFDSSGAYYGNRADIFFSHYGGESGWQNLVSAEQLLEIGRTENMGGLTYAISRYPEVFVPYLTDEDIYLVLAHQHQFLLESGSFDDHHAVWAGVFTSERRSKILAVAKAHDEQDWREYVGYSFDFFADTLELADVKTIYFFGFRPTIRASQVWKDQITPELEYQWLQEMDEDELAYELSYHLPRFKHLLTPEDKLLILKYSPMEVLRCYRYWQPSFSPEFIVSYFESGEVESYGRLVLSNQPIFEYVYYSPTHSLSRAIEEGGLDELFSRSPIATDDDSYTFEKWSDLLSITELYDMLKDFEEGRTEILEYPDLFFEFVVVADLDLFIQAPHALHAIIYHYDDWQALWSYEEIYQAARRHEVPYTAAVLLDSSQIDNFRGLIQQEDLHFLLQSYNQDLAYLMPTHLEFFGSRWTVDEIFTTLKVAQPTHWGDFVTEGGEFFESLVTQQDLANLVQHGAKPDNLASMGLWKTGEILDAYIQNQPGQWGRTVIVYYGVFKDEVVARDLALLLVLENGGAEVMNDYLGAWEYPWSRSEIITLLREKFHIEVGPGSAG